MLEYLSSPDKVKLTHAVFKRFCLLTKQCHRRGKVMDIAPSTLASIKLYNQMRYRYLRGILTHTEREAAAEQEVCQWLVSEWKRVVG